MFIGINRIHEMDYVMYIVVETQEIISVIFTF